MNEEKTPAVTDTAEKKKKTTVKKFAACVLYVLLAASGIPILPISCNAEAVAI